MTDDQPEAAEPNDEPSDADDAESSGIQEGDFVRLAYTARSVENDQLVDTTDPDVAEEEGVDDQQQTFEPRVIAVGAGHLFDAVEEDFIGGEAGDSGSVTVPAAEAFGEYDEEEVRTLSAEKIPEDDRYPGGHVDIEGEHGHVNTIIGGRARVDFNHPLAGEDVEYEYEVLDTVDDRIERAEGMLGMYFDADLDMRIEVDEVEEERMVEPDEAADEDDDEEAEPEFETETVEKETLYIEQSQQLQFDQQWMMGKQQILGDLIDRLDLDRVIVEEVIDGSGGMMGGMGGMMGGMGGGGEEADLEAIEEELEDADIDADEITEELGDVDE
ncbi:MULTISPECIES: FKBP-type peptidyl-prolyl cis-trans isomerase [Halococcus]|uniref:peptidylprolyl isomerase n=1 Tax=Halococcus salifodinae DSM 8989 TaxID=1227456 RepID=M0NGY5_9EURY|nr:MULTISPECIES: FKBP-type peptidyl-prolyl cis-trans isomerase [Halococcus]EMA55920.1 FKBP-type peptidylprolyl isomerase [Halococcus salifodinae DSM 8989]